MKEGYFKAFRGEFSLLDPFWGEKREFSKAEAWLDLRAMAAYVDHEVEWDGKIIVLMRGQVPTSERRLMDRWGWGSRGKVRRFLEKLEKMDRIKWNTSHSRWGKRTDHITDHGLTLLTICNYDGFRGSSGSDGTTVQTKSGTSIGPRSNQTEEREKGRERNEEGFSADNESDEMDEDTARVFAELVEKGLGGVEPSGKQRRKQVKILKELMEDQSTSNVFKAIRHGMNVIYPFSAGERFDAFDVARCFPKAMAAAEAALSYPRKQDPG